MKKPKIFLIVLSFVLFLPALSFSLVPYDDFSGTYIDRTKWRQGEMVREIDSANQRLLVKQASTRPSAYPYWDANRLAFVDPNSVNSIQADVTIHQADISNQAETWARVSGTWYYDGTAGGGIIGSIVGEVFLRKDSTGLYAAWEVVRLTSADGSTGPVLGYGEFATPISAGTTYTLYVSYDPGVNQFTFKVGAEEKTFGPVGLPTRVGYANVPRKVIGTRVDVTNSVSSGYISATFDNIYKNGVLYDDFSPPTIDETKWIDYEYVKEISDGKLRSKVRSSTASTSGIYNRHEFLNPSSINVIQAKVTPTIYENAQGAVVSARIGGIFYNDGTPGGGFLGDVGAEVYIGGTGENPIVGWTVWTFSDSAGSNSVVITSGTFATPITLGNTYTLLLGWDGSQITFKIDNESASYTPVTSTHPPNIQSKEITTRIRDLAGKEATIEALFDDVMVNPRPEIFDFDGDRKADIAFYRTTTGVWWITPSSGAPAYGHGWGGSGFKPVPGDYDGDGKTDIAIYDTTGGAWWIIPSSNIPAYGVGWGGSGFKPVTGDYDGDGKTDIAIYDTTGGAWWIIPSSGIPAYGIGWGGSGFKPVPGDYDGDKRTDIAIYDTNGGAWWIIPSSGTPAYGVGWGGSGFSPVLGDYDGDGKTDIAIYNTTTGAWWIIPSSGVGPQGQVGAYGVGWGGSGFTPVPGDYDGDGKTDVAIYQNSNGGWWIIHSSDGSTYGMGWGGEASDVPLTTNPD